MHMRGVSALLVAAAVVAPVRTAVGAGSATAAPGAWLTRINSYRAAYGRAAWLEDHQASRVAQRWTQQMAAKGVLHNRLYRTRVTPPWYRIAENVGYTGSEATLFRTFTGSPNHRANMLRPEFNRVGIGQAVVNGRLWTTHIFLATRYRPGRRGA